MTTVAILDAETRIQNIENKAVNVAMAVRGESQARDDRDEYLEASVNSLIGQPNPLTGKDHSATSAEKAVKAGDDYKAKDREVLNAECRRIMAWSDYERAKLSAKLAVAGATAEASV